MVSCDLTIRPEREGDVDAIRETTLAAFPTMVEANLIDALRHQRASTVSLVAVEHDSIVGHILFSPVTLAGPSRGGTLGLAPMAVRPDKQRQGIGSQLVHAGLVASREAGAGGVVVVGHAGFYPRFGFVPASRFGLRSEYNVSDEVFMAIELLPDFFAGRGGLVRYHPAFAEL